MSKEFFDEIEDLKIFLTDDEDNYIFSEPEIDYDRNNIKFYINEEEIESQEAEGFKLAFSNQNEESVHFLVSFNEEDTHLLHPVDDGEAIEIYTDVIPFDEIDIKEDENIVFTINVGVSETNSSNIMMFDEPLEIEIEFI